ncbi:cholinesterase-like [Nomia melanderi]|uniref:cholinesterase-like n=1 Tax=Nomia melanderi TaxID=2448451 RepID=UPI0013046584|nr:cholinesterase 1-like [Nomia melanderi]
MKLLSALAVLLMSVCLGSSSETPVIRTQCGPVQGEVKTTAWNSVPYWSFQSIPYGKPPVGNLRFRPPMPAEPWTGTLKANKEPNACPQLDIFSQQYIGNEDCLYINVFTPVPTARKHAHKKAVMAWIYGGSFAGGSTNTSIYGPDLLIEQDVVVVTFNYRLGALGFLALGLEGAPGNGGLKDQALALKWIQQNIAAFGGDPRRVTIFGESSGSASVHYHVLSPHSAGLFARAIAMSGTPLSPWAYHTPEQSLNKAKQLTKFLGSDATTNSEILNFLLNVPPKDLVNGTEQMDGVTQMLTLPFRPTLDSVDKNPFLTQCPISIYKYGSFSKVPIMLGKTKEEALGFTRDGFTGVNDTWTNFDRLIDIDEEVFNRFVKDKVTDYGVFVTDYYYTAPTDLTRKFLTKYNNEPVYSYEHTFDSPYALHRQLGQALNGTSHFDDVQYVFYMKVFREPEDPNDPVNRFRKMVSAMWANFAKYGNPTPRRNNPSNAIWEPSGCRGLQFNINSQCRMQEADVSPTAVEYEKYILNRLPTKSACHPTKAPEPNLDDFFPTANPSQTTLH